MAKTKISDLGSGVCVNDDDEHYVPALGNGVAVPGDACYRDPTTGRVVGTDEGAADFFEGFLMEDPITGTEAAPAADVPCRLVVPKSNHRYRVRTLDLAANKETGQGMDFSATAYKMDAAASINVAIATLNMPYVDDDTVAEITWR